MQMINEVYLKIKGNLITKEEGTRLIIAEIYKKPFAFGLGTLDEDGLIDFLIYEMNHLEPIFDNYREGLCAFSSYLYKHIEYALKTWQRKEKRVSDKNKFVEEYSKRTYGDLELDFMESMENELYEKPLSKKLTEISNFRETFNVREAEGMKVKQSKEKSISTYQITRLQTLQKEGTILSALKNCNTIEDDMILKICELTNYSESELRLKIDELRDLTKYRVVRREKMIENRNTNYFYKLLIQQELEDTPMDSPKRQELLEKHESYCNKIEKQNAIIRGEKLSICPSNRQIADVMGINERHVQYIFRKMEENMDTISMNRYYEKHEDLSGNW